MTPPEAFLDAVALDGSPGQAYASHKARTAGIARYFASTRPLDFGGQKADENNTVALLAHLHAASLDAGFTPDGQSAPSAQLAPRTLMTMNKGDGKVGTGSEYDFALKGLAVMAYRYGLLLGPDAVSYILNQLVPGDILGPHNPDDDGYSILGFDIPETENHLLMIESSRYLFNQLFNDIQADDHHDNNKNGLTGWLLSFLQQSAMHDFMEFSARPYARFTLHVLLNLYEFARDEPIRTAAQILLDYTMMKCALSSSRQRRVNPYRRHQEIINHQANPRNYLFSMTGDQVNLFLLTYTGATGPQGMPSAFPPDAAFCGVIAGTSSYRPPPAAYLLAMQPDLLPSLHVFNHGVRPRLTDRCSENAEGGLEIYFKSPSFLMSAGGNFLNSGYGKDEIGRPIKNAWEQTTRAQATTLIPTKADVLFADLIRFEPWPDPPEEPSSRAGEPERFHTLAVSNAVGAGIACGPNLRPAEKKIVWENTASGSPCLGAGNDQLYLGWRASDESALTVAKVQHTAVFGVDGVEGVTDTVTLGQSSDDSPALAVAGPQVILAWRGSGNKQLNVAVSTDGGLTFPAVITLDDSSDLGPALAVHNGTLFISWVGLDNDQINIAKLVLVGSTSGAPLRAELDDKIVLNATTDTPPALGSAGGLLFIAWRGSGNPQLNAAYSQDNGHSFTGTATFADSSDHAPALATHNGSLYMAWTGRDNQVNIAQLVLLGNTSGAPLRLELDGKVILGESTGAAPALTSYNGLLFLAWTGGDDYLNLRCSRDGTFGPLGPWIFFDGTALGFFAAAYRTPATVSVSGDEFDTGDEWVIKPLENLAIVYAMEAPTGPGALTFGDFCTRITQLNGSLPPTLQYNSTYEFHTPDEKQFSCWFKSTEQKYQARILDLGDASPTRDLSTLPLVSGPFMTCPGGHDGLIQIRQPGCPQPVVLDFRTLSPSRTDNKNSCPQPWVDRARALFAIASAFNQAGRTMDAQTALIDAVELWSGLIGIVDPLTIAQELNRVAGLLSAVGLTAMAVETQKQAVDLLRGFTPADPDRREYLITFAEVQQDLIVRLTDDHRPADAAAAAPATIVAYRAYVAESGADANIWRLNNDLTPLQKQLSAVHLTDEPVAAAGLLVDAFSAVTVQAEHLEFDLTFADARQNLVARLIDARRPEDAAAQATQAIAAYRQYAAESGADHTSAINELTNLANVLQNGGLTPESQNAKDAATAIGTS